MSPGRHAQSPGSLHVAAPRAAVHDRVMDVLITFPLSHYCEKARWALDHAGLDYRERGYPPVVHTRVVRRHGGQTVPLLLGAQILLGSTDILRLADQGCSIDRALYPVASGARREIDELVARLDTTLGPQARRWFYCWAVAEPARLYEWGCRGLPPHQQALMRVLQTRIATRIAIHMEIDEHTHEALGEGLDQEFGMVSALLADGRRYLGGDSFSAADLTFAALAGPILQPPGYGGTRITLPPMPDELAPQILAWRATPAGQHALRVYREHRDATASDPPHDRVRPSAVARASQ